MFALSLSQRACLLFPPMGPIIEPGKAKLITGTDWKMIKKLLSTQDHPKMFPGM